MDDNENRRTIYPWADHKPDCKTQSAGDWYQLLLASSFGGKPVHGANTSPSTEVLCKATSFMGLGSNTGLIKWLPAVKDIRPIGTDLSDQFYEGHLYRGTVTASGNILAYESGLWEPSMRKRARATSLLAAGIHAHGQSKAEAVEVVSKIASDDIDEEAVESVILPVSHLKREMTIVSKANHRIFSKGTLQGGIMWVDGDLRLNGDTTNIAFDWGRVTAVARYIGEVNIQVCPRFRKFAQTSGVPFFIVRNSWAYVAETDYMLTTSMFSKVKRLDIKKYGIPSIKGAFVNHEQDVMIALTRMLETHANTPDTDTFNAYLKLYKAAKARKIRGRKEKMAHISQARDLPVEEQHITPLNVGVYMEKANLPWKSLVRAVATRREHTGDIKAAIAKYETVITSRHNGLEELDIITTLILNKATWLLAKLIAEQGGKSLGSNTLLEDTSAGASAVMSLSKLKASMFGYPTHLDSEVYFQASVLVNLRRYTKALLEESTVVLPYGTKEQKELIISRTQGTSAIFSSIVNCAIEVLPELKSVVSEKYANWAIQALAINDDKVKLAGRKFEFTAFALKNLSVSNCLNKPSGFIDGAEPEKSYIYQKVRIISKELGFECPKLRRLVYASARGLAEELDQTMVIPFSMSAVVEYVTEVLDQVVGDMMLKRAYHPAESTLYDLLGEIVIPDDNPYPTSIMTEAEQLALLEAQFLEMEEADEVRVRDPFKDALNTYERPYLADTYARYNGYKDFKEAFEAIGLGACFNTDSDYIINAQTKMQLKRANKKQDNPRKPKRFKPVM